MASDPEIAASEKPGVNDHPIHEITSDQKQISNDEKRTSISSSDVDAALQFLQAEGSATLSEVDEKALVRKIDWMLIPLMWACYNLQYLDKVLSTQPLLDLFCLSC
jgi:hypothetical protein